MRLGAPAWMILWRAKRLASRENIDPEIVREEIARVAHKIAPPRRRSGSAR
jgi:hypothetical protein